MTESEPFRGLRETLRQLGAVAGDLHRHTPQVCQVSLARDRVAERLGLPDVPTPEQQEALHRRFRRWLNDGATEPDSEDWALAPFVYFSGEPPLGGEPRFALRVAQLIAEERQPRVLRRAVYAYLRDFDPLEPVVSDLAALIGRGLDSHKGRWAEDWLSRVRPPHRLFEPAGLSDRLADEICSKGVEPRSLLRDLGLSTELITHCGLHQPLIKSVLAWLSKAFSTRQSLVDGVLQEALLFLQEGGSLRFPHLRAEIAHSLLAPFAETNEPNETVRGLLTEFFDNHYGDPRNAPDRWEGVSTAAKTVMQRWLVRKSLDLFFDVLSKTADPIWRYRRAFWLALFRHGLIEDAWPAFGRVAGQMARADRKLGSRLQSFGELKGGQANQSVMVMQLRSFIVAEWSHAGACRVWSANDGRAPRLPQTQYVASELREDCLYIQAHTGPMGGSWQLQLSTWIGQRTGVRIPLRELMANTHA